MNWSRISKWVFVTLFISSSAFLINKSNLWRELTPREAAKRAVDIPSWAPLVEKVQPAVVVITTEALIDQAPLQLPGLPGPFQFFMPIPPEKQRGQGSGFIINENGYIITNEHVIAGAQKIKVKVGNSPQEFDAKIIGADETLDIALIKLDSKKNDWPFIPLGNSRGLKLGEPLMALGSPLGLEQSVNVGIVSQKHRGGIRPSGRDLFVELLQLQMPINPGNSGGPIVNSTGEVVAVSESILASGQAIAFGVPIDLIKSLIPQLLKNGQIEKAYLGVEPVDLTPPYAEALGLPQNQMGAVVKQVMPNTPAQKAGIQVMDVILEFDQNPVADSFNLRQRTAYGGVGKEVTLKIFRKGKGYISLKVKLEKRPGQKTAELNTPVIEKTNAITIEKAGLKIITTPDDVQKELNLSNKNKGAFVVAVKPGSPAAFADIQRGDVIIEVSRKNISSAKDFERAFNQAPSGKPLLMITRRKDSKSFVALQVP